MAEIPEDQLIDLIIHSISGDLTDAARQELMDWAQSSPARESWIRSVHNPVLAGKKMSIYLSIDFRKGYARWLQKRRRKKQLVYYLRTMAAAMTIGVALLWWKLRADIPKDDKPPGLVEALAMVERSMENATH